MKRGLILKIMDTISLDNNLIVQDLGLIDYNEAYAIQKKYVQQLAEGGPEILIVCEHPTVLTLGRMTNENSLLVDRTELDKKNIAHYEIDRGGDVTLHAPGQLIVYPIINLSRRKKDLHLYLNKLEQVCIELLGEFGIAAVRSEGRTGVWVGSQKIVSIGVGVRKWITYHGVGINVSTDLSLFSLIRPCGMDVQMTSMDEQLKSNVDMSDVKTKFVEIFQKYFTIFTSKESYE